VRAGGTRPLHPCLHHSALLLSLSLSLTMIVSRARTPIFVRLAKCNRRKSGQSGRLQRRIRRHGSVPRCSHMRVKNVNVKWSVRGLCARVCVRVYLSVSGVAA